MEIKINQKIFHITPTKHSIESIVIFGSYIRGSYNEKSDIDFLIIIDNCSLEKKAAAAINICNEMNIPLGWLSLFTIDEFRNLCTKGTYFIWSTYLEGKIFYSRNNFIENSYKNLPLYFNMKEDIARNYTALMNLKNDLRQLKRDYGREICLIGYIIRNTLMILTYSYGYVTFDKYEVIDISCNIQDLSLPFTKEQYYTLLKLKEDYKYDPDHFVFPSYIENYIGKWLYYGEKLLRISEVKISQLTSNGFISPFIFSTGSC